MKKAVLALGALGVGAMGIGALGIGVLGAGTAGFFGGSYYAYRQAFYAKGSKKNIKGYFENNISFQKSKDEYEKLVEEIEAHPFEDVYIKSHDGLMLHAKYYHIEDGAPLEILIHGYKGKATRDMCGAFKIACELSHNTLLIDQRGCGSSQGNTVTFGILEREDMLAWVKYACARFGDIPIFLWGISMGGAVALMTSDMNLPKNVMGVIADCPYTSPEDIVKKVFKDRGIPSKAFPAVTLGARLYGKFDLASQSALKSVLNSKVPILIIHGEKDHFVPPEMSQRIYDSAACRKQLHIFEGADHCASYMSNPEKYKEIVSKFTDDCINYRHSVE